MLVMIDVVMIDEVEAEGAWRVRTTTPPSKMQPTMVVPVLVAFGSGTPWA